MSYATNIGASQQESTPELYQIVSGSTTYRYTSYNSQLLFQGNTYTPASIKRGGFSHDNEFSSVDVTLTAAVNPLFLKFVANYPIEPTNVKIYRAISSDLTDYVTLFNGYIKNVSISDNQASVTCSARSVYLEKKLPRIIYQAHCNHDIYDNGCGVSEILYRVPGAVTALSGSTITASPWTAYADDYFLGGLVRFGDDARLITESVQSTGTLTLQVPFDLRVKVGTLVTAIPGCDGNPETCVNRFNNLTKFLGFPYIPSRNPYIFGIR